MQHITNFLIYCFIVAFIYLLLSIDFTNKEAMKQCEKKHSFSTCFEQFNN